MLTKILTNPNHSKQNTCSSFTPLVFFFFIDSTLKFTDILLETLAVLKRNEKEGEENSLDLVFYHLQLDPS